jgi:hypothetical protein
MQTSVPRTHTRAAARCTLRSRAAAHPLPSPLSPQQRAAALLLPAALCALLAAPPAALAKAADFGVYWVSPAPGASVKSPVGVWRTLRRAGAG